MFPRVRNAINYEQVFKYLQQSEGKTSLSTYAIESCHIHYMSTRSAHKGRIKVKL